MKSRSLYIFAILITLVLIGTANADWIFETIASQPILPKKLGMIVLGATMVAFAVVGRPKLKRPSGPKTQSNGPMH